MSTLDPHSLHESIPSVLAALCDEGDFMFLTVDTAATLQGDEEPVAFLLGSRRVCVLEVLDRWLSTEQSYYKILADDGALYILRREMATGDWEMTLFRAEP